MIWPATVRCSIHTAFAVAVMVLAFVCCRVDAQQTSPAPALSAAPDANGNIASSPGPVSNTSSRDSLTAAQIYSFLQQRPEIVIDLKAFVADQLRQQGTDMQADAITDEMLFSQIASNATLRTSVTLWLRSRGYITEADIRRPAVSSEGQANDEESELLLPAGMDRLTGAPTSGLSSNGFSPTALVPDTYGGNSNSQAMARRGSTQSAPKTPSKQERNVTDEPDVLHVPAPYNLRSLRDLYTQIPQDDLKLRRFGSEVFLNRDSPPATGTGIGLGIGTSTGASSREMPIDIPVGPDYVLGPGDGLTINLWGGISQSITRVIDREGKIVLPEAGSLVVAGFTLEHAQAVIASALKQQFHNLQVDITIARLRTVRVYVVGDVQRPGAYDISSLSTPLNALYAAGGPTSVGSLRIARHIRGKELVREVDLYEFLLRGVRPDTERIEDGDTILVSPVGRQVAVAGMVKRPAIYELKDETRLSDVLKDAGGVLVSASLTHITIERVGGQGHRTTLNLDLPEGGTAESSQKLMDAFAIQDGDRVSVAPILPYSERAIYVEGHVVRPGKFPYRDDMKLSDVIRSYQDLLPEPADRGVIIRLM